MLCTYTNINIPIKFIDIAFGHKDMPMKREQPASTYPIMPRAAHRTILFASFVKECEELFKIQKHGQTSKERRMNQLKKSRSLVGERKTERLQVRRISWHKQVTANKISRTKRLCCCFYRS
jgi:hypothetical protein